MGLSRFLSVLLCIYACVYAEHIHAQEEDVSEEDIPFERLQISYDDRANVAPFIAGRTFSQRTTGDIEKAGVSQAIKNLYGEDNWNRSKVWNTWLENNPQIRVQGLFLTKLWMIEKQSLPRIPRLRFKWDLNKDGYLDPIDFWILAIHETSQVDWIALERICGTPERRERNNNPLIANRNLLATCQQKTNDLSETDAAFVIHSINQIRLNIVLNQTLMDLERLVDHYRSDVKSGRRVINDSLAASLNVESVRSATAFLESLSSYLGKTISEEQIKNWNQLEDVAHLIKNATSFGDSKSGLTVAPNENLSQNLVMTAAIRTGAWHLSADEVVNTRLNLASILEPSSSLTDQQLIEQFDPLLEQCNFDIDKCKAIDLASNQRAGQYVAHLLNGIRPFASNIHNTPGFSAVKDFSFYRYYTENTAPLPIFTGEPENQRYPGNISNNLIHSEISVFDSVKNKVISFWVDEQYAVQHLYEIYVSTLREDVADFFHEQLGPEGFDVPKELEDELTHKYKSDFERARKIILEAELLNRSTEPLVQSIQQLKKQVLPEEEAWKLQDQLAIFGESYQLRLSEVRDELKKYNPQAENEKNLRRESVKNHLPYPPNGENRQILIELLETDFSKIFHAFNKNGDGVIDQLDLNIMTNLVGAIEWDLQGGTK